MKKKISEKKEKEKVFEVDIEPVTVDITLSKENISSVKKTEIELDEVKEELVKNTEDFITELKKMDMFKKELNEHLNEHKEKAGELRSKLFDNSSNMKLLRLLATSIRKTLKEKGFDIDIEAILGMIQAIIVEWELEGQK